MKTFELNGTSRPDFGKKASKAVRKEGKVPCILYGGGQNVNFSVDEKDVRGLIYTPEIFVVEITIDGKKYKGILKELQFHPVKDNVLHIDFYEVAEAKPILIEVPVRLNGLAEGVKAGGKLSQELRKLKVKAIYTDVPEVLNVDVTNLGLGKTMQVGTLSFPKLEIITNKQAIVCAVKLTRVARGLAAAAAKEGKK
jgi:large subunit ribosomal protein L25